MSIGKLEEIRKEFHNNRLKLESSTNFWLNAFMHECTDILVAQAFEMQELRKQLAKKEDVIDVNNIKIGGTD